MIPRQNPNSGRKELQPVSWFIDLLLEEVLAYDFMGDPAVAAAYREAVEHRANNPPRAGTYRSSSEYERLCNVTGVDVLAEGNSLWQLLYDGCQPFNTKVHSTGLVGLTCSSLEAQHQSKGFNIKPLLLVPPQQIPGQVKRKEPSTYKPMLKRTLCLFQGFSTGDTPPLLLSDGSEQVPYLDGVGADSAGRPKWSDENLMSSSFHGCGGCGFCGYHYGSGGSHGKGAIYHKGYAKPAKQP
jgi:hypothetical protein